MNSKASPRGSTIGGMSLVRLSRRGRALLAVVLAVVAGAAAAAQPRSHATDPGVWKPWKGLTAIPSVRADRGLTAAQVKAFEAELLVLNGILRRAEGVAAPVGFSVETWGYVSGYRVAEHAIGQPPGARVPAAGALTFGAFPIFEYERNGRTIVSDTGETALLQFYVNDLQPALFGAGRVTDWGSLDTDAVLQPAEKDPVAGLPRVGDTLVIARDPAALWAPVSLRAALDLVATYRRAELQDQEARHARLTAQLATLRDPARRAAKAAEAAKNAASMPEPEKFIAMMAEAARIEEASVAGDLAPAGGMTKALQAARGAMDEVTAFLEALTAEENAAPACHVAAGTTLRARFRAAPMPGCVPIARPNYGAFNPALPRTAPQVVIIAPVARCFETGDKYNRDANAPGPAGCAANRRLVETMDQAAIRAWLR